jgi:hypothetical protein
MGNLIRLIRVSTGALLFILLLFAPAFSQSPSPPVHKKPVPAAPPSATAPPPQPTILGKDPRIVVFPNPMTAKVQFYRDGKLVLTGVTNKQYTLPPGRYSIVITANESYFTYWKVELTDYELMPDTGYSPSPHQRRTLNWPLILVVMIVSTSAITVHILRKYKKEKEIAIFDARSAATRLRTTAVDGIPEFIDRFTVLEKIGAGAWATVFKVQDKFGDIYALKVPHSEIFSVPEYRARFVREAEIIKGLHHPNIVRMYDFNVGEDYTVPFICLEYVAGTTLREFIRSHPNPPLKRVLSIIMSAAEALGHAHSLGVVHRDIKPENIMITDRNLVKVMDLGIARAEGQKTLTARDSTMGTPYYISPEQVQCLRVDGRADLYALGVVLYEMLAGHLPFMADDALGVILKHLNEAPVSPSHSNKSIPRPLDEIVMKLLEKKPEDRFRTAEELVDALKHIPA